MSLFLKIVVGTVGYVVWAVAAWYDPALREGFVQFNQAMVFGTIGLGLRDLPTAKP